MSCLQGEEKGMYIPVQDLLEVFLRRVLEVGCNML